MDPFVVFIYRDKKYQTQILDEAGQHPVWNHSMAIPVHSLEDELMVKCFDEEIIIDQLVGEK